MSRSDVRAPAAPAAPARAGTVPVIGLTGYLGAGKTSLLNHLLRRPGARIGVVVNDFGELNVDAGLVTGQVDEPASISGGCLCCVSDTDELDVALARLTDPRLALDAIVIEASGLADPMALARLIRFSGVGRVRPGGIVDVVDATHHEETVDVDDEPPLRYAATALVVVNKLDGVPAGERDVVVERVRARVRRRNPHAHVVGAVGGRVAPELLYDVASTQDEPDQLPIRQLMLDAHADGHPHDHVHAESVTVRADGPVAPGPLVDLLEAPPPGVYRLKGLVAVPARSAVRTYAVNVVGTSVHVATGRTARPTDGGGLVAIGTHLESAAVRERLRAALRPAPGTPDAAGFRRLQRLRRLSL